MDPSPIDPHNHAPEVTPDDVWGDAAAWTLQPLGSTTVLPFKKARAGTPSSAPVDRAPEGLRIESKTPPRRTGASTYQLEVQEIDGNVVRLDPEVPTALRVPRQPVVQERPAENDVRREPQGEGREWGLSRKQSIHWILGAGLGIASVVIVALMLLPVINASNAARPNQSQTSFVMEKEEDNAGSGLWNALIVRQQDAEQVFRAFASAPVVEDILPLVKDSESVGSLIRAHHRPALVAKAWVPPANTRWNVIDNDGHPFGLLEGFLPDDSTFGAYVVLSGRLLLLDWKATTAYGTATFDELEGHQGNPAEIRARIVLADFFTATFPEAEYQCYQLLSPDNRKAVWCYARRGEAANAALASILQTDGILDNTPVPPQKVTVRLDPGPAGSLPNQWLIREVLHKDWITSPTPPTSPASPTPTPTGL